MKMTIDKMKAGYAEISQAEIEERKFSNGDTKAQ